MSDDNNNNDYEVGYKHPPKEHQFKSGQSGNSKGRPKPSSTFSEAMSKELKSKIKITENGKQKNISKLDAIAKKYTNSILTGDATMTKIFFKEHAARIIIDYKAPPDPTSDEYTKEQKYKIKQKLYKFLKSGDDNIF